MKRYFDNLVFILMIAGFVVGIHAGIKYGMPQYVHWVFNSNAKELERITYNGMPQFKEKIVNRMKEDNLPVDFDKLDNHLKTYTDRQGVMHAEVTWSVHVDYYGFFPKDFHYRVEVSR